MTLEQKSSALVAAANRQRSSHKKSTLVQRRAVKAVALVMARTLQHEGKHYTRKMLGALQ